MRTIAKKPTLGCIFVAGGAGGGVDCETRLTATGERTVRVHAHLLTVVRVLLTLVDV